MRTLHISVLDKKATYLSRDGDIVCGNSDYVIEFAFDAEWDAHDEKIARFIWNEHYEDVTFTGTSCPVPIITNTTVVEVGVYAGELSTTTPAVIGCQKSILCKSAPQGGVPFIKGDKGDPGEGIPEITETDNGKVLTAENGVAVWKDRDTIYDCTGTSTRDTDHGNRFTYPLDNFPELVEGATYKVYYDGELYECVYEDKAIGTVYGERGETMWGLGNEWYLLPASGENTGEPFFVYVKETGPILFTRGDGEHTLTICETNIKAATSWNDLEDKPFGDESVTIEWDGDTEGHLVVDGQLAKISDLTPQPSELLGSVISSGDESLTITEEMIDDRVASLVIILDGYLWVSYVDNNSASGQFTLPEKGIYCVISDGMPAMSLTYGSIKKLDPKYLPEGGVGYEGVTDIGDTLTWDGVPTDTVFNMLGIQYFKVSDNTPTSDELIGGRLGLSNGGMVEIEFNNIADPSETVTFQSDDYMIIAREDGASFDYEGETFVLPKKGIYFLYFNEDGTEIYVSSLTIPNYNFTKTEVHKIDKKFLPDSIHYYDSLSSVPADLPDGSFVAVPSEGESGEMAVVNITSAVYPNSGTMVELTADETTALVEACKTERPIKVNLSDADGNPYSVICNPCLGYAEGILTFGGASAIFMGSVHEFIFEGDGTNYAGLMGYGG